jgi:DNA-directed RNA polymerase subunit N
MIIPVRCFTCGKVIGDKWEEFKERAQEGQEDHQDVLDELGITKYCCRTVFLTHVGMLDDVAEYKKV